MPRFTEADARAAVASSLSYTEVLRKLGLRPAGGNHALLRRYVDEVWRIPTDHFDPDAARRMRSWPHPERPLEEVLVLGSQYSRGQLKKRLYRTGLKARRCELCGQDENWHGARMALILDHINGVGDDNRLENLRIVCPNCAATLATHCGRNHQAQFEPRACLRCGNEFLARQRDQRYCSRECGMRAPKAKPRPHARKAQRPSYERLRAELAATSFCAVARKYGVSDNAVRKWLRAYERSEGR